MTDDMDVTTKIDTSRPNVARVWDYQLGGKDNFEADRAAAAAINKVCEQVGAPDGHAVARENRAFIGRAVRYLALKAGIDQFVDLGSGLPTEGNVHEAAQSANRLARTVYVDYDLLVLAHGRALLALDPNTIVVEGDVREPEAIFANPKLLDLIDLSRPVAVLLVAMLHLIPDDEAAARIVARIRDAIAPGSYLALTHTTSQHRPEAAAALAAEFARLKVSTPLVPRDGEQIHRFFDGFELVEPGLVSPPQWRPAGPPDLGAELDSEWMYAGVARLPVPGRQDAASAAGASNDPTITGPATPGGAQRRPTNQPEPRIKRRAGRRASADLGRTLVKGQAPNSATPARSRTPVAVPGRRLPATPGVTPAAERDSTGQAARSSRLRQTLRPPPQIE